MRDVGSAAGNIVLTVTADTAGAVPDKFMFPRNVAPSSLGLQNASRLGPRGSVLG
jgi:hypothetical protein